MTDTPDAARRDWLRQAAAGALLLRLVPPSIARAETPTGWTAPRPLAPALALHCADGQPRALRDCLRGAVTAVQLMFTGCSATCPVQGALFADIAARLPPTGFRLLSISIDALADDAPALQRWQARYGASAPPGWRAGVPELRAVESLSGFLRGQPAGQVAQPGTHTAQVFVFDREARLAYRTGDNPPAAWLEALMVEVSRRA